LPVREQHNKVLREAFEGSLDIVGYGGKITIIHELEERGAYHKDDDTYLSLWKIGEGLRELFGQEIAEMIMEKVMIRMDKLFSLQHVQADEK